MTLKVLHIGKYFIPHHGGIETFMSQLMAQQAREGMKVSALIHTGKLVSKNGYYEWQNCKIYEARSYGQLVFAPVAPGYLLVLKRALENELPDILHLHMPNLSAFWVLFVRGIWAKRAKIVIHWHSDVLGAAPTKMVCLFYPLYRVFEKLLLNQADKIIATSPPYLETSQPLKVFKEKCLAIPLGIKLKQGTISPKKFRQDSALRFCIVGRLVYYKGHSTLLKAIKELNTRNFQVMLNVVGDGELKTQLMRECCELKIDHIVNWHGSVSEQVKDEILKNSDLLLLPSLERTEAFGVTLLEAASLSLPVLVSDVKGSGMTYVVQNLYNGLVCKVNNHDSLAEQLMYACQNQKQLAVMGERNAEKLTSMFSINSVSERITELYKTLVKG